MSHVIAVCSWSLQVQSIAELTGFLKRLGINAVQIACGDPHHASWTEGDEMPAAALAAGFLMTSAMIGFPGEDYTTPDHIKRTGGFGDPALRKERLDILEWALARTRELGLNALTLHAGFIPPIGDLKRSSFLDCLGEASSMAQAKDVTLAFETGQETAGLLMQTLTDLRCQNLRVNFDPANMLLYDMGDPIQAVQMLAPWIHSVHVKDAIRPEQPGTWGREVPLGEGEVNITGFLRALKEIEYTGPLCIEREVGTQQERFDDINHGITVIEKALEA